jgi:hypothetical protein
MNHVMISFLITLPLTFGTYKAFNINPGPRDITEIKVSLKEVKAFSSDWESPSSWNTKYEGDLAAYYFERQTPELSKNSLAGGIVAVFARGIKDDVYNAHNKPLSLPFYLFPVHDNVNGLIEYRYATMEGKVQMVIQMQKDMEKLFNDQRNNIQFRYFFLPDDLLKQHKISKEQAKQLTYNKILEILQPAA